ncbi:DNA-binding protein [Uniformispora flossi]|uniref:DNA-binding protein n=1 Tax=Uniformispora flossi TaxID=3390723 RepID=UPI003C2BD49C
MSAREKSDFLDWVRREHPHDTARLLRLLPGLPDDLKTARRRAWSQPKKALGTYQGIAAELTRSAPHLLPGFHEYAARAFLSTRHQAFAAQLLAAARQAEAEHGLPVDDDHVDAIFLEFVVADALPAKAVAEYSKDLSSRFSADEAFARFARLCVRRTEAGMPPSVQMASAIRKLAREAGDKERREQEYVAEILRMPVVVRAPAGWWTAHRTAVVAAARRDPALRGGLLNVAPKWHQRDMTFDQARALSAMWIALLEDCGATAGLGDGADVTDAERPSDGTAGWLVRILDGWSAGGDDPRMPGLHALLPPIADRIRGELAASGRSFEMSWRLATDVDLIDLLLSLDIPVSDPDPRGHRLELDRWARGPERRDLRALAASPALARAFGNGARGWYDDSEHPRTARTVAATPGGRELLADWIRELSRASAPAGLPNHPAAQQSLAWLPRDIAALAPDSVLNATKADLAPELARTLRTGLTDELCWPEFEELARGREKKRPIVGEAWPYLIVAADNDVRVLGPEGVVLRHTARVPEDRSWRLGFRYVDGALLVYWKDFASGFRGYWYRPDESPDTPAEPVPLRSLDDERDPRADDVSLPLPGGGRFTGRGILAADASDIPGDGAVSGDGTHFWAWDDQASAWFRHDPVTGLRGDRDQPAFLAADGLDGRHSWVRPAPGVEPGPVGVPADGLLGWRVTAQPGGMLRGEDLAGRVVTVPGDATERSFPAHPFAALTLPGDDRPRALLRDKHDQVDIADPDGVITAGTFDDFRAGNPVLPPTPFWHLMRIRDAAGSAALRAIDDETAAALLKAAAADDLAAAIRSLLPAVTDPVLAAGIAGVVRFAAQRRTVLDAVAARITTPEPENGPHEVPGDPKTDPGDELLRCALDGLGLAQHAIGKPPEPTWAAVRQGQARGFKQLRELHAQFTARRAAPDEAADDIRRLHFGQEGLRHSEISVEGVVLYAAAIAFKAASPVTPPAEQEALHILLTLLDAFRLGTENPGSWRRLRLHVDRETLQRAEWHGDNAYDDDARGVLGLGGGAFLFVGDADIPLYTGNRRGYGLDVTALIRDPSGIFALPDGYTVTDAAPVDTAWFARLGNFLDAWARHGQLPWNPAAADVFAEATGVGRAVARLVTAGLPELSSPVFPSAELRAVLGLKASEAEAARGEVWRLAAPDVRAELVAALLPADPARLWTDGVDAAAAAQVWNARVGRLRPIPDPLLVEANATLPNLQWARAGRMRWASEADLVSRGPAAAVRAVLDPDACPELTGDHTWTLDDGRPIPADAQTPAFHGGILDVTVTAAQWLAHRLPAGDPLRSSLPTALARIRERLAAPGMLLDLDALAHFGAYRTAAGEPTETGEGWERYGAFVVPRLDWDAHPGIVTSPLVRTDLLDDAGHDPYLELAFATEPKFDPGLPRRITLGRAFDPAFAALLGDPGDPVAGSRDRDGTWWPQDPSRSVPDLVAEVAAELGLAEDAATLFLMLLAMPDPTDRNTALWTGWKPARAKAARAALAGSGWVVEARRARAGRSLFLPGEWEAAKAPHLPLEAWKLPLYGLMDRNLPTRRAIVPAEPAAALYRRTWQRVRSGDSPRHTDLSAG